MAGKRRQFTAEFKLEAVRMARGNGKLTSQEEEIRQLRREVEILRQEREIQSAFRPPGGAAYSRTVTRTASGSATSWLLPSSRPTRRNQASSRGSPPCSCTHFARSSTASGSMRTHRCEASNSLDPSSSLSAPPVHASGPVRRACGAATT